MKKITSLGTITLMSLAAVTAGVTAASAAGTGTLTTLEYLSNASVTNGTMSQDVTRVVNGDATAGSATVDGCVIDYVDGVEVNRVDSTATLTSSTDLASAFGFSNTTTATKTFTTEIYNVACEDIIGEETPIVATYDVLPNATWTFDTTKAYQVGTDVGTDVVTFTENSSFNFGNGGTIALAEGEVMPDGLTAVTGFDAVGNVPTLEITGTPTTVGSYSVIFDVADTYGNSSPSTLSIEVTAVPVAPSVSASPTSVSGVTGTEMTDVVTLTTTGDWEFTADPTVEVTGLPTGVIATPTFETNVPVSVTLSGTPTTVDTGTATITITDAGTNTANTTFTWEVTAAPVPATFSVSPSLISGTVDTNVDSEITLTLAGDWDFSTGSTVDVTGLPAGLTSNVTKDENDVPLSVTVSGLPTEAGVGTFDIAISDNFGNTQTQSVNYEIEAAPLVQSFEVVGEVNFMEAVENSVEITFTNDVNYDWTNGGTVVVNGLPAGLTYTVNNADTADVVPSVTISGTATENGAFDISYVLSDNATPQGVAQVDAVATVVPSATSAALALLVAKGSSVYGSNVEVTAEGLEVGSEWTLTLASTPVVLKTGTVAMGGSILDSVAMPTSGLSAGWHSLTLSAVGYDGTAYSKVTYFEIDASGNLVQTSDVKPADVTPTPADSLAKTGFVTTGLLASMFAMLAAGAAFLFGARRRKEANN